MNYGKEIKEVRRNNERRDGILKIVNTITGAIKNGFTIAAKTKVAIVENVCDTVNGVTEGIVDLGVSECNYEVLDEYEREEEYKKNENSFMKVKF